MGGEGVGAGGGEKSMARFMSSVSSLSLLNALASLAGCCARGTETKKDTEYVDSEALPSYSDSSPRPQPAYKFWEEEITEDGGRSRCAMERGWG